jgi:hypothetical protein
VLTILLWKIGGKIMVLRSTVNRQIKAREYFDVKIKRDGKLVNKNSQLPPYDKWRKAQKGNRSVAYWKKNRFFRCYPGYEVDVLYEDGRVARGKTLLTTVRDSYEED